MDGSAEQNSLEVPDGAHKCKIDAADTRLCQATVAEMVYDFYCFSLDMGFGFSRVVVVVVVQESPAVLEA
jgi:hypothetical protein